MKVTRIPLTDTETLEVQRFATGAAHLGITRSATVPDGKRHHTAGGNWPDDLDQVYSLDNAQREQLREALR